MSTRDETGRRSSRRSRRRPASSRRTPGAGHPARRPAGRAILVYKPYDVLCKFSDAEGRPTLKDYVDVPQQVYPAGRLDKDSEGLVLLTDDGRLAHQVTHPRHKLPKTYLVQVEGIPDEAALLALRRGVDIPDKRESGGVPPVHVLAVEVALLSAEPVLPSRSKPVRPYGDKAWLRLVIQEGKKRQVRHMTAAVGYPTLRLVRVAIGPLTLGDLQPGQWRDVTRREMDQLRAALTIRS